MIEECKHSPLPWKFSPDSEHEGVGWIRSSNPDQYTNSVVCAFEKDAEFIVRACNAHYDLVEALKECRSCLNKMSSTTFTVGLEGTSDWDKIAGSADLYGTEEQAHAALAKAKGDS